MKKFILSIFLLLSVAASAENVVQCGYVRTSGRPDNLKGTRLPGVVIRIRGQHNPVMTDENGEFKIVFPEARAGADGFYLTSVILSGYELNDAETIGREFVLSPTVPLEIVMVSLEQKFEIENRIRNQIEANYSRRLKELRESCGNIGPEEYNRALEALEDTYSRRELLIQQMVERYSHTDYAHLSDLEVQINSYIEKGELEKADSVIDAMDMERLENDHIRLREEIEKRSEEILAEQRAKFVLDSQLLETYREEYNYFRKTGDALKVEEYLEKMRQIDSVYVLKLLEDNRED